MLFLADFNTRRKVARARIKALTAPISIEALNGTVDKLDECQSLLREIRDSCLEKRMRALGANEDTIKVVLAQVRAALSAVDEIAATLEEEVIDLWR